jgi:hypothetical protein
MSLIAIMAGMYNVDVLALRNTYDPQPCTGRAASVEFAVVFESAGTIILEELELAINRIVPIKMEEIVDRARVAFHLSLGERKEAQALVAKHLADVSPFAKYREKSATVSPQRSRTLGDSPAEDE